MHVPGMSMNDHMNSFNKILADLLNLDEKFKYEYKALLLLDSLHDKYDHLTTTLFHGKDNVTFDIICSALYNSETIKKDKKDHRDIIAEALTVRCRSQSRNLEKRASLKGSLQKMSVFFLTRKGIGKRIVLSYKRASLLLMHV